MLVTIRSCILNDTGFFNMVRIALITATPPSVNPGMLACEATARSFLYQADLLGQTTFFRVQGLEERSGLSPLDPRLQDIVAQCDLSITFETLKDVSQLNGLIPIFWGDFLHMNLYLKSFKPSWSTGLEDIRRLLLLEDAPMSLLNSAISYGSSFLFNSTTDYYDPLYGAALRRFISNAHHIQMRDAISAAVVSGLRLSNMNCFGLDPAQLLSMQAYLEDILGLTEIRSRSNFQPRALLFFARGKHDWEVTRPFVNDLLNSLDMKPEWLAWGDQISFPYGDDIWLDLPRVQWQISPGTSHLHNLLETIRNSSVVITDTYHLVSLVGLWEYRQSCYQVIITTKS